MKDRILSAANRIAKERELLYVIAVSLTLFATIFASTVAVSEAVYQQAAPIWAAIFKAVRYAGYALLLCVIGADCVLNKIKILPAAITFSVTLIAAFVSRDMQICIYAIAVIASANIGFKKILRIYMRILLGTLMFIVLLSAMGGLENFVYDLGGRNRNTLGFVWTTICPMLFLFATAAMLCLQKTKVSTMTITMTGFSGLLLFALTDSKFIFMIQACIILLMFVYRKYENFGQRIFDSKVIRRLVISLPVILFIFSLILPMLYHEENSFFVWLNELLSGRLNLAKNAMQTYGFSVFGQEIKWMGYFIGTDWSIPYNYVDSSYVSIVLNYGALVMAGVLFGYTRVLADFMQKKEYAMTFTVILVLLLSFTEPRLINIMYNPFILAAGVLFSNRDMSGEVS